MHGSHVERFWSHKKAIPGSQKRLRLKLMITRFWTWGRPLETKGPPYPALARDGIEVAAAVGPRKLA